MRIRTIENKTEYSPVRSVLAGSLLALFYLVGVLEYICVIFHLEVHIEFLFPVGTVIIVLCMSVWKEKWLRRTGIGVLFIWCGILYLLTRHDMINGLRILANNISDTLGAFYGKIFPRYEIYAKAEDYTACITFFLLPLVILLSLFAVYLVQSGSRLLLFLLVTAFAALQFMMGSATSFCWLVLLLVGSVIRIKWAGRLGDILYTAGLAGGIFLLAAGIVSWAGIGEPEAAAVIRTAAVQNIDNLRYKTKSTTWMPEGNFKNMHSPEDAGNAAALEVTMQTPESYYLRGYVGAEYTKSGWQNEDSQKLYAYRDLFYWLHKDGFYGQSQLAEITNLLGVSGDAVPNELTVHNVNASSKYQYLPYEYLNYGDALFEYKNQIGDSRTVTAGLMGERDYTYLALPNQVKQYPLLLAELLTQEGAADADTVTTGKVQEELAQYLQQERYYNRFVYETYLDMPDSTRNLLQNHLGVYDGREPLSYTEAKEKITAYLLSHVSYSTRVREMEQGKDFLQYFLEETASGYSVHYATAASLMFRYYGIPSRYVEGYLITPEDIADVPEGGTIEIGEDHAHAWAEYYQDGIGWIPFEATPAYDSIMEQAQPVRGEGTGGDAPKQEENYEMKNENYEPDDIQPEDGIPGRAAIAALLSAAGILLLFVLGMLGRILCRRRRWRKAWADTEKERAAVAAMQYETALLGILSVPAENNHYRDSLRTLEEKGYEELRKYYEALLPVYEKAKYGNTGITQAEYDTAMHSRACTLHWLRQSAKRQVRIKAYLSGL